jgi:hypothetical protein
MLDRQYGPTTTGKVYLAVSYHQRTARKRPDKSRWIIKEQEQYNVFEVSDNNQLFFPDQQNLVGLKDNCSKKLGCDEERLARLVAPSFGAHEWHGFPVFSREFNFSEEFLDLLEEKQLIDRRTRNRLVKCQI